MNLWSLSGYNILYGGKVGKWTHFEHLAKERQINRSANRLLIVSTNLDSFSLANHGQLVKFANISSRQSFPPYSNNVNWGEYDDV